MSLDKNKKLAPAITRHLLYRIIGGVYISADHLQLHELQVLAELVPAIWNDPSAGSPPRYMNQYSPIFSGGYCLNCHSGIIYHDGTSDPLQLYCGHCKDPSRASIFHESNSAKHILAHSFLQWEPKYQFECIKFLVELTERKQAIKWQERSIEV